MNIDRKALGIAALAALVSLSGCATYGSVGNGPFDDDAFGEANRQTMAAQIIDPDPQYDEPMATSGEHAAQAIERYRTDAIKQPERISSTSRNGRGGGSNGGSGGGGGSR
ncbi:MAG: hypothetical protein AB7U34_04690 [Novosphingobium sp.]